MTTSAAFASTPEEVYRGGFYNPDGSLQVQEEGTLWYGVPGVALVHDNALYGWTGPISGGRDLISFDVALGYLQYRTWVGDARRYYNLLQRYALAIRVLGATSDGRNPQYFRIGGPYTLRGYEYGEFRGTKLAMANVEFRFPLIEQLRFGWPLPLASIENRRSLVYVGNLCDAIIACLESPAAAGKTLGVTDGAALSTPALCRRCTIVTV